MTPVTNSFEVLVWVSGDVDQQGILTLFSSLAYLLMRSLTVRIRYYKYLCIQIKRYYLRHVCSLGALTLLLNRDVI